MKFLVTGGAGFIGSSVVRYLLHELKHEVINIDKLTYAGNLESLDLVLDTSRYNFEQVDICNKARVERIFMKYQPDKVMHFAAESHVDRSIEGPAQFIQTNIVGTYIMLDIAKEYWQTLRGDKKKTFCFHHVSTDEVYGDLGKTNKLFNENTAYSPSSPYSASKASADHLVRAWNRTYGLPVVISNCSNNYGPYQFPEKLIPLIILNAINGNKLPVYGDGSQVRDWLYVEDHAKALIQVVLNGDIGETYNIGGNNEKTNLEVVLTICKYLDELMPQHPKNISSYDELVTFVEDRPGHDIRYAIDASKINNKLGWKPDETFDTGIKKTISWYLDNKSWCDRVIKRSSP